MASLFFENKHKAKNVHSKTQPFHLLFTQRKLSFINKRFVLWESDFFFITFDYWNVQSVWMQLLGCSMRGVSNSLKDRRRGRSLRAAGKACRFSARLSARVRAWGERRSGSWGCWAPVWTSAVWECWPGRTRSRFWGWSWPCSYLGTGTVGSLVEAWPWGEEKGER